MSELKISGYIKESLLFNEKVVLPGFGAFVIKKEKPRVTGKKIEPPSSYLYLDTDETLDDEILSRKIADSEEISPEEAKQKILEFTDKIRFALNKTEPFTIEGVGTLQLDENNEIQIEKSPEFDPDPNSFGLESFEIEPLESEPEEKEPVKFTDDKESIDAKNILAPTEKTEKHEEEKIPETTDVTKEIIEPVTEGGKEEITGKNNKNTVWIISGAIVVILAAFILIPLTTNLLDGNFELKNIFPGNKDGMFEVNDDFSDLSDKDFNFDELVSELNEDIDSATAMQNALNFEEEVEAESIPAEQNYTEYHIIAGSFTDYDNARELQQNLSMQGYQGKIIDRDDGFFRVSALVFRNKETALAELYKFREQKEMESAWLMGLK